MKIILVLLLLVGVGWVALYYGGGYGSFDPSEQCRQARAAMAPGITHAKAFDICGDPRKVRKIRRQVERYRGEEIVTFVPGPPTKTSRERMDERVKSGDFPYGFVITYRYSDADAFAVHFDELGIVEGIDDVITMADLLQYRD